MEVARHAGLVQFAQTDCERTQCWSQTWWRRTVTVRKSHLATQPAEWQRYVDAVSSLKNAAAVQPAYADFVNVHVQAMTTHMEWSVHTMHGMVGTNFLTWHRWYLLDLEQRLQQIDSQVFIPYWDWQTDSQVPAALSDPALLARWSVDRSGFDPRVIERALLQLRIDTNHGYVQFQKTLEALHGSVHNAFEGDMAGASSPNDPIFFLHHANVDRLWSMWQASSDGADPPNMAATLLPQGLFGVPVSSTADIAALGYSYAPSVRSAQGAAAAIPRAALPQRSVAPDSKVFFDVDALLGPGSA